MTDFSGLGGGFKMRKKTEMNVSDRPLQYNIEAFMNDVVHLGNYEAVYLFDKDGLALAQSSSVKVLSDLKAVEVSVMMNKVQKIIQDIGGLSKIKEIVIEDDNKRKMVFRFIQFFGQTTILVIVIPAKKSYRGLTNRLEKLIAKQSRNVETEIS